MWACVYVRAVCVHVSVYKHVYASVCIYFWMHHELKWVRVFLYVFMDKHLRL